MTTIAFNVYFADGHQILCQIHYMLKIKYSFHSINAFRILSPYSARLVGMPMSAILEPPSLDLVGMAITHLLPVTTEMPTGPGHAIHRAL